MSSFTTAATDSEIPVGAARTGAGGASAGAVPTGASAGWAQAWGAAITAQADTTPSAAERDSLWRSWANAASVRKR